MPYLELPQMPSAGAKVATELEQCCSGQTCPNLNNWLNELYLFRQEYLIYQQEVIK